MKKKVILILGGLFLNSCFCNDIIVKKFFPSNTLYKKTFYYKGAIPFKEKIAKVKDKCLYIKREYKPFKYIEMEEGKSVNFTEAHYKLETKNLFYNYKLCQGKDKIIIKDDKNNKVLLTNKNSWNYIENKNIVNFSCRVSKKMKKKVLGNIHNIVKVSCDFRKYFLIADGIGIIESGMSGVKNGIEYKLVNIK